MKKWFIISLLSVLIFIMPVYAAQTIYELTLSDAKIFINGNEIKYDSLPVLNYKGNNYIPLRKVGETLGVSVQWDGINKRVLITNDNVVKVKLYSQIQHEYYMLEELGEMLNNYSRGLSLAYEEINSWGTNEKLEQVKEYLKSIKEKRDTKATDVEYYVSLGSLSGIDVNDMNTIIQKYSASIQYYEDAIEYLELFYTTGKDGYLYSYSTSSSKAFEESLSGESFANNGHNRFYQKIIEK